VKKLITTDTRACGRYTYVFIRGGPVNGGHLRELQDKTKSIRRVENVYKLEFSGKHVLLQYAM
jgi:hypothetical protein